MVVGGNFSVMTGYQEQHLRRKAFKGRVDAPAALLTDPDAYLSFLETQLERVSAACMAVAQYDRKFSDMQDHIVQLGTHLENRCTSNNKLIELAQQTSMQMHKELSESINTTTTRLQAHIQKSDARLDSAEKRLEESEDAILDLSVLPEQVCVLEKRVSEVEVHAKDADKAQIEYKRANDVRLAALEERSYSTEHRLEKLAAQLSSHQATTSEATHTLRCDMSAIEARLKDAQAADRENLLQKLLACERKFTTQGDELRASTKALSDAQEARLSQQSEQAISAFKSLEDIIATNEEAQRKHTERVRNVLNAELDELKKQSQLVQTSLGLQADKLSRLTVELSTCQQISSNGEKQAVIATELLAKFKPLVVALAQQQASQQKSQSKLEKAHVRQTEHLLNQIEQQEERVMEQLQNVGASIGNPSTKNEILSQLLSLQEAHKRAHTASEAMRASHIQYLFEQQQNDKNPFLEEENKDFERKLEVLVRKEEAIRLLVEEAEDSLKELEHKGKEHVVVSTGAPRVVSDSVVLTAESEVIAAGTQRELGAGHPHAAESAPAPASAVSLHKENADIENSSHEDKPIVKTSLIAERVLNLTMTSGSNSSGEVGDALRNFLNEYDTAQHSGKSQLEIQTSRRRRGSPRHGSARLVRSSGTAHSRAMLTRRSLSSSPTRSPRRLDYPFHPTHNAPTSRAEQQAADARRSNTYAAQRLHHLNTTFGQNLALPNAAGTTGESVLLDTSLSGISDGLHVHHPVIGEVLHRTRFLSPHFSRIRASNDSWRINKTALYPRDTSPERFSHSRVSSRQTSQPAGAPVLEDKPRHSSPNNYGLRSATAIFSLNANSYSTRSSLGAVAIGASSSICSELHDPASGRLPHPLAPRPREVPSAIPTRTDLPVRRSLPFPPQL